MPWLQWPLLVSVPLGPSPGMEADQTIISFNDAAQEEDEVNLKELDDELKKQKQRQVRCSHDGIV